MRWLLRPRGHEELCASLKPGSTSVASSVKKCRNGFSFIVFGMCATCTSSAGCQSVLYRKLPGPGTVRGSYLDLLLIRSGSDLVISWSEVGHAHSCLMDISIPLWRLMRHTLMELFYLRSEFCG